MREANIYFYQIPMDSGVILREQRLTTREGFIIALSYDGVHYGFGEVAPLPEFSKESLEEVNTQLRQWLQSWIKAEPHTETINDELLYPSVASGLSFALAELEGSLLELDLKNIRLAPLCSGDPDELIKQYHQPEQDQKELTQGLDSINKIDVLKMKVGMYEAVRDGIITNLFLESLPDLHLRLDANRNWSLVKTEQFSKYVNPIYRERIDFIEEPCFQPEDSLTFARAHGFKIAWDESLRESSDDLWSTVFMDPSLVRAIIIKPMLTGSLAKCQRMIQTAREFGIKSVISSSFESSFGLTQLLRFAQQSTPNIPAGLDTLQYFKVQLERPWPNSKLPVSYLDSLVCEKI